MNLSLKQKTIHYTQEFVMNEIRTFIAIDLPPFVKDLICHGSAVNGLLIKTIHLYFQTSDVSNITSYEKPVKIIHSVKNNDLDRLSYGC
jgi:hypothetical protein